MATHSYKELIVWQKSTDLVYKIYGLARQLPEYEKFALADQIRRSSVSIPSNIAEGQKRFSNNELKHFCSIALGSAAELETQLLIIDRNYYIDVTDELNTCSDISKLLTALIKSLSIHSLESKN